MKKAFGVIFLVLLIDQAIKFYIKTHFYYEEMRPIAGRWFYLHFVENNGMAFGYEMNLPYGKLLLSVFRLIAISVLAWYIIKISRQETTPTGLIVSLALIFAGAVGNIIDSAFYGMIFSASDYEPATFLPSEGGYSTFLHGRVVDMFYFPLIEGHFPNWFPIWGSEQFIFFRPIFNFADASITVGVAIILLFQKNFYPKPIEEKDSKPE